MDRLCNTTEDHGVGKWSPIIVFVHPMGIMER